MPDTATAPKGAAAAPPLDKDEFKLRCERTAGRNLGGWGKSSSSEARTATSGSLTIIGVAVRRRRDARRALVGMFCRGN